MIKRIYKDLRSGNHKYNSILGVIMMILGIAFCFPLSHMEISTLKAILILCSLVLVLFGFLHTIWHGVGLMFNEKEK